MKQPPRSTTKPDSSSRRMARMGFTDSQLDAILSAQSDSIYPSSGFTDSVMSAVYREAPAFAPIPFPWRRAIPGIAAILTALCLLGVALFSGVRALDAEAPAAQPMVPQLLTALHAAPTPAAVGLLLSAAITLAALLLCRRLLLAR